MNSLTFTRVSNPVLEDLPTLSKSEIIGKKQNLTYGYLILSQTYKSQKKKKKKKKPNLKIS